MQFLQLGPLEEYLREPLQIRIDFDKIKQSLVTTDLRTTVVSLGHLSHTESSLSNFDPQGVDPPGPKCDLGKTTSICSWLQSSWTRKIEITMSINSKNSMFFFQSEKSVFCNCSPDPCIKHLGLRFIYEFSEKMFLVLFSKKERSYQREFESTTQIKGSITI